MKNSNNNLNNDGIDNWLLFVKQQIETLDYGVVQIVVHDSKIVQVERTEKIRIEWQGGKNMKCCP